MRQIRWSDRSSRGKQDHSAQHNGHDSAVQARKRRRVRVWARNRASNGKPINDQVNEGKGAKRHHGIATIGRRSRDSEDTQNGRP